MEQIKISQPIRQLIHEINDLAMDISSETVADVITDYRGNVQWFQVDVHLNGASANHKPDFRLNNTVTGIDFRDDEAKNIKILTEFRNQLQVIYDACKNSLGDIAS